jgi:hypothetical protein
LNVLACVIQRKEQAWKWLLWREESGTLCDPCSPIVLSSVAAPVSVHHLSSAFGPFFRCCHWLLQLQRGSSTWNPSTTCTQIPTCAGNVQQCSLSMRGTVGQRTLARRLPALATLCGAMQASWAFTHLVLPSFLVVVYEVKVNARPVELHLSYFSIPPSSVAVRFSGCMALHKKASY